MKRISETLKKAAGLLIEFDEPTPEEEFYRTLSSRNTEISPTPKAEVPGAPISTPIPAPATVPAPAPLATSSAHSKTVEQLVRETPGPNLDEIKAPATTNEPIVAADGSVSYGGIYKLAGLPASPFTAEQVLELLATLPAELPLETKRATVKVTLNAMSTSMGVSAEGIVADASRKLAALAAYAQSYVNQVDEYVTRSEVEIARLEAEIATRRQSIADAKTKQTRVSEACTNESDRLDDVLEFFSLDISPSKYASKPGL